MTIIRMTHAGSLSQPSKRQKTMVTEEPKDQPLQLVESPSQALSWMPRRKESLPLAKWTHPLLSLHEDQVQPELFKNKLSKKKPFIQDKAVKKEEFEGFGVIECFTRLGWDGVLNLETPSVYKEEVIEWMSTLKKTGSTAQDTKLTGKVGGKVATLDLAFIQRTFEVDTGIPGKPDVEYKYLTEQELTESKDNEEEWKNRLETIFQEANEGLLANNLNPLARVLWRIGLWNIHPRLSDPERVRRYEVSIIYALMTGEIPLSYSHLVLSNIWKAHELQEKKHIPHPFIISELLRIKKVIPKGKEPTPIWLNHRFITRTSFHAICFVETDSGERYLCRKVIREQDDMEQAPSTQPDQGVEFMSLVPAQQVQVESQLVLQIQSESSSQQHEIPITPHESVTHVSYEESHLHVDHDVGAQNNVGLPLSTEPPLSPPRNPSCWHHEAGSDRQDLLRKLLAEIGKLNERVGQLEAQQKKNHEEIMQKLELLRQEPSKPR